MTRMLTTDDVKLAAVLADPAHAGKRVPELCRIAGVSEYTYYRTVAKPAFQEMRLRAIQEVVRNRVAEVLEATIRFATTQAGCHQDRRLLLEIAGIYVPTQRREITGAGGGAVRLERVAGLSEADISALLQKAVETGTLTLEQREGGVFALLREDSGEGEDESGEGEGSEGEGEEEGSSEDKGRDGAEASAL